MYGKKVKLRAIFILSIFFSLILIVFLVFKSLEENVVYFKSPTEIKNLTELTSKKIRVGGMVKEGSLLVQRNEIPPITTLAACTRNSALTTPHPSGLVHGQIVEGGIANLNFVVGPWWEGWCLQPGHSPFAATMLEGELILH